MENGGIFDLLTNWPIIVLFILAGFVWARLRTQRVKEGVDKVWSRVAANTGLEYTNHSVHGTFQGCDLRMTVQGPFFSGIVTRREENSTRIQIRTWNVTGATLTLQKINALYPQRMGAIWFGDESFDNKVVVQASSGEFATAVLSPLLRERFFQLLARRPSIRVTLTQQGELTYLQKGVEEDVLYLKWTFEFLANLAAAIERFV